jgi:DNA invertase Pin-like site-specific DNA recombinase/DNA-binding winged helix-turn-helix (wHTH) protein
MPTIPPIPAAQYLRMSTDDQPNSIPFQKEAIRLYAEEHGFEVIATYSDPGKSGIEIKHRPGLRKLIQDVVGGRVQFKVILVYDISRWGRFQDTDESAYYEFLCRKAGVPIHYCAEEFINDGTMPNAIMKALKRTMAAEFSRELSVKVRAAQRRVASAGFRVGGRAGFGLRRMLVSQDGHKKLLRENERKGMATDGVTLVPGPKPEVECIRTIFRLAGNWRNSPSRIAAQLNRGKVAFTRGRKWTEENVRRIIENEKYSGTYIWGKTEKSFNTYRMRPAEQWIRKTEAFPPLVTPDQFVRAQKNIQKRRTWPSRPDAAILKRMRLVFEREGRLTEQLLRKHGVYDYRKYYKRYGSVLPAYKLIGFHPSKRAVQILENAKKIRKLRSALLAQLKGMFPSEASFVRMPGQIQRQVVEVDEELKIALHVCRPTDTTVSGDLRWILITQPLEKGLGALVCTTDLTLQRIRDYYVVPPFPETRHRSVNIGEKHPWLTAGTRLHSLSEFCTAVKTMKPVLRSSLPDDITIIGDLVFSSLTSTISISGEKVHLPASQAAILKLLAKNSGNVVSRAMLAKEGLAVVPRRAPRTFDPAGSFVKAQIYELRRKLGHFRNRIVTVQEQGFVYQQRRNIPWLGETPLPMQLDP